MANVQKYTRADVGGGSLTRHYERAKDGEGNYHTWGNQEIDPNRSHLNYNLASDREQGQLAFINERISEVKCHKRDDVNIMCSWIVTVPKDLDESEHEQFFKESYDFLCKKYGEKNVVSAWVHMDETTPHLHFTFVPVVVDKKKGHEKVSAKEALGWSEKGLHKFHGELDAHMTAAFGRDIGILNEATRDGNKTVQELKRETAILDAKTELEAVKRPIEGKIAYEKRINRIEDGIKEKTIPFTKRTKVVITVEDMTEEEAKTVLAAARDRDKMRIRRDKAIKERDGAFDERDVAVSEKNKAVAKLKGIEQRESATKKAQEQAAQKQAAADALYQQQATLNEAHSHAVAFRDKYKADFEAEQRRANIFASEKTAAENALTKISDTILEAGKGNKAVDVGQIIKALSPVPKYKGVARELERVFTRAIEHER